MFPVSSIRSVKLPVNNTYSVNGGELLYGSNESLTVNNIGGEGFVISGGVLVVGDTHVWVRAKEGTVYLSEISKPYNKYAFAEDMASQKELDTTSFKETEVPSKQLYQDFIEITDQLPTPPEANTARIYAKDNGSGLTQLVARFANGAPVVLATQEAVKVEEEKALEGEADFLPKAIKEETPGGTVWTGASNLLNKEATYATVKGGNTGKIAGIRFEKFEIEKTIPSGATIESIKAVYKVQTVGAVEGNPITSFAVKTAEAFKPSFSEVEIEGAAVPSSLTEIVTDITKYSFLTSDLSDSDPLYFDIRCRNNTTGKETEFKYQYVLLRIKWKKSTPGKDKVIHVDPMSATTFETDWGSYQAASLSRYELINDSDGDKRPKANGEAQASTKYRRVNILHGDVANVGNERAELGANERRYGIEGGIGTFMLYQPEKKYQSWFSLRPAANFPIGTGQWQVVMQMKSTQPYTNDGLSTPVQAMQLRQGQWQWIVPTHNESNPLYKIAATVGVWTRFCVEAYYYKDSTKGWVRIQADTRSGATTWVPQVDSGILPIQTLATATSAQSGSGWTLEAGQMIPAHFRLGIYRNPAIYKESAYLNNDTYIDIDNVEVIEPAT